MNIMQRIQRHNYANALANAQAARASYRIAQLEGDNAALRAQVAALQAELAQAKADKQTYYELFTDECKKGAGR